MDLKGSSCPICFESLKDKIVGSPDVCDHKFCLLCLEKWTKHENFCPVDRRRFKKIISGDKVIRIKHKRKKKGTELYDISVYCEICKETKENNDTVILCDCCDLAFHFICLKPPLKSIPHGNWYCPDCLEISRKLESQKKEKKKHSNNPSVYSKQSSTLLPPDFAAPATKSSNPLTNGNRVKNSIGENTNMKLTNDGHNYSKESHFSEKDDCQKNFSDTKTVNVPFNCTDTPSGEFEDFFNISNNVVILMNRKFLRSEGKSLNKSLGKECRTNYSMNLRRLQHAKDAECNNFKMQQIEKRTKRLAATTARKKMIENLKKDNINCSVEDSSYSSGQCSAADMEKGILFRQTSILSVNKNADNYMDKFSLSQTKPMNEGSSETIQEYSTQTEKFKKIASSKSSKIFENLATYINAKSSDSVRKNNKIFICDPKEASLKTSSTSTKIYSSMAEKFNVQNHTVLESSNISREVDIMSTNCKALSIDDRAFAKKYVEDTFRANYNLRALRKGLPETKPKRLAAAVARRKLSQNFSSDLEFSSDESSNSLNHHNVVEKDSFCNSYLNDNNHYLFTDIEKVLSNQNSRNEFLSSKSESENAILDSDSRCSKSTKKINIVMKDSNKSSESKSSNICENLVKSSTAKVSDCVTESSDSINSHSVFKKPGCESFSACTKINDSMTEELNNAEIPMALESLSVSEKHENTPELTLEPLHIFKNSESEMPSESPPPSLIPNKNLENEVFSIKDAETEHDHSVVEESNNAKNGSSSETFSVFEKITDTSSSTEKFSNMNRYNNEETCSHMEDYQSAENPKNDEPLQEKDNYDEIEADENILNNFHMRQVHYAIKAKINLPAELQKIEEEAWLSHRSKSSRKYKNKSFHKKAKVCISHDQVVSRKKEHCVFSNDTPHSDNKSTYSKQDVKFNNKFNPFCQSVCGSPPKKLFKVTEYAFQQVRSKNVLQNIMDPYSLKHLDIREDGSLFLNWNKSNCVASF
ncbi:uncharacterized protein LOC129975868 isoform X1 [Argiope bruennichi]|uniref:uncharacterized protein LOC129975868 isoform X1 n=1 Tax=Argiope bruennichi TaxID=94029 RepID=UPI0024957CA9|nr:uncharacterized protein LOC129975868 isoform X1 [Argiope bruennichi]